MSRRSPRTWFPGAALSRHRRGHAGPRHDGQAGRRLHAAGLRRPHPGPDGHAGIARAHIVGESLGSCRVLMIQAAPSRVLSWTAAWAPACRWTASTTCARPAWRNCASAPARHRRRRRATASARAWSGCSTNSGRFVSDELVETRLRFWSNPDMLRIQPMIAGIMDPERGAVPPSPPNAIERVATPTYFLWTEFNPTTPWQAPRRPAGMSGDRAWTSCRTADTGRSTRIRTASTSACSAS